MKVGIAKRISAIVLATALALTMVPAAFAQNIIINSENDNGTVISTANGAYEAYEIFKGDIVQDPNTLKRTINNVEWGSGVNAEAFIIALKADTEAIEGGQPFNVAFKDVTYNTANPNESAKAIAVVLDQNKDNVAFAKQFAKIVNKPGVTTGTKLTSTYDAVSKKHTIATQLQAGKGAYYFVKDAADATPNAPTAFILSVASGDENVEVTPKADLPGYTKEVADFNDSEDGRNDNGNTTPGGHDRVWGDSADHDNTGATVPKIGDRIPFRLVSTLPGNLAEFKTYHLNFYDNLSAGLTFYKDTVKVYVVKKAANAVGDKSTIDYDTTNPNVTLVPATNYEVITSDPIAYNGQQPDAKFDGGSGFTVKIADVKSLKAEDGSAIAVEAGDSIVVRYDSLFNDNAIIGADGNFNESWLGYSRNPNDEGTGVPENVTDKKTNVVFTYKYVVNKKDENGNPLAGAEFTLEKKVAGVTTNDGYVAVKKVTISTDQTTFTFTGLDDGTYRLKETKIPTGYAGIKPFIFKVEAVHQGEPPKIVSMTITDEQGNAINGDVAIDLGLIQGTQDPNGEMSSDVENNKAPWLPTTGGMGTFLLYLVGGALIVGAGVLLFVKKRAGKKA